MYTRISKNKAHRLYAMHKAFIMVPSKMRPDSFMAATIDDSIIEETFDLVVASFERYNCINKETGLKAAFYMKTS